LPSLTAHRVKQIALDCGFDLAGIVPATSCPDYERYREWTERGHAGEMTYLTDRRGAIRNDPRLLLPSAKSILCVGKLYNSPYPYSTEFSDIERAWISRYAWGDDYHGVLRAGLEEVAHRLTCEASLLLEWKICVDTAPLLERSYARLAGLGWIGRNTCLINEQRGSWFFLGELLLSVDLEADQPPPDRCGTCRRCIDACPTQALIPAPDGSWTLDSRLCISYLTIEKRGAISDAYHSAIANNVFGCDICQDVCPWNRKAPVTGNPAFQPRAAAPPLERMANLSEEEFRNLFRSTPLWRTKYRGFLRNIAIAIGNSGNREYVGTLSRLAAHVDEGVSFAARLALDRLQEKSRP
jgi:epoxyqueuosine reductase